MFTERAVAGELSEVRDEHAPEAVVLDCERDFQTLPPAAAEDLALVTESLSPRSYPDEWLAPETPEIVRQAAGEAFTIGWPGDGGVTWTRQTTPPVVVVKPRLEGSPEPFVEFLLAAALVEVGSDLPEDCLAFFGERYRDLAAAADGRLDGVGTYQLAAALCEAYRGLHTREVFAGWRGDVPGLFSAWQDAGERLEPRLSDLSGDVASGRTGLSDAAELACSAVKHGVEIPKPFDALDTAAYREHGADFACKWVERTFESLE